MLERSPLGLKETETRLSALLQPSCKDLAVFVTEETESTNADLMRLDYQPNSPTCVLWALKQSQGKGRQGRQWLSDEGSLTFSIRWQFKRSAAELNGLPLAVAVATLKALQTLGIHSLSIKWPNDLLKGSGKLSGILLEIGKPISKGMTHAVIGIGINIQPLSQQAEINHEVAALYEGLSAQDSQHLREETLIAVIQGLTAALRRFDEEGFSAFRQDWMAHAAWLGKKVALSSGSSGTLIGVDQEGALLLDTDLCIERFLSGDLSLRPIETLNL
jgi:BirA family transcriptional regulator, biotin operon repressor / biotin---[acetyl-CoA-carboxylase] ligase